MNMNQSIMVQQHAVYLLSHRGDRLFDRSIEMVKLLARDERVAILLTRQQKLLGHSLPLTTYLFKPVQRILRYHLLLQVLLGLPFL